MIVLLAGCSSSPAPETAKETETELPAPATPGLPPDVMERKNQGKEYAAKAAQEPKAEQTASGLVYKEIKAGTGASPTPADMIRIHYRGTFLDGKEFDSSYKTGAPAEFPLGRLIPCWIEGIQKMKVGGKAQLVCPSDIAYGDFGRGEIPGGATLLFEVELFDILK